ncbi:MAG: multicopper oxidase domain-containing protein [Vitreoscilla sp.]|nr:multicopper oxidase domain-containing protein [Burkholderiales bacterium]MBP6336997.1 multicopper oxidase domain-containing protein [Vitreoscilla sp.]
MSKPSNTTSPSRRRFVRMAGQAAAAAAGLGLLPFKKLLGPVGMSEAQAQTPPPDLYYAGTDGWIHLPDGPIFSNSLGVQTHPDDLAPAPFNTYIFGFRDVTGHTDAQRAAQKNKAQHSAPMFWVDQFNPASPKDFRVQLTNLGLAQRPDLFDAHTIHWHGFRNVITFFDGEPTGSVAVMTGRTFQYIYRPRDPGTYMFHCHVEDTEHVHMGMTGPVFVRPLQNGNTSLYPSGKYAYNDGNGSTGYDREFAMFCSEVWGDSHWADSHIQLPEWSDYRADFSLLNGRVYPDTLAPHSPLNTAAIGPGMHSLPIATDASGDLIPNAGLEHLQYQPLSALVTCNAGDRVLLRFANLGFREAVMTLAGMKMKVVGKDATPMRGRDVTDTSYLASTVSFGAGESIDAIFTAPPHSGGAGYDTYLLYDRAYERSDNLGGGGRRTEVRVYPAGTLPTQGFPNDLGDQV